MGDWPSQGAAFNDSVNPTASQQGDAATPGAADGFAARRQHKHGRENVVLTIDDFDRQITDTPNAAFLAQRHFDAMPWVQTAPSGTAAHLRDAKSAGDTTFPDTGVVIFDCGSDTNGVGGVLSSGDTSIDALSVYDGLRDGTIFHIGSAVPSAGNFLATWGLSYPGSGNDGAPDFSTDIVLYANSSQDYDVNIGRSVVYHGFGSKRDFVALRIGVGDGINIDLYYICSATAFAAASSAIVDTKIAYNRSGANYNITATLSGGLGSASALAVAASKVIGWLRMHDRATGMVATGRKLYVDYIMTERPLPVSL